MEALSLFIRPFDLLVFAWIIIILIIRRHKKVINLYLGCIGGGFLFGFLLPAISVGIEVSRVSTTIEITDNFEIAYTLVSFPMYWLIGGLFVILLTDPTLKKKTEPKNQ